jgi:hypothetical protein
MKTLLWIDDARNPLENDWLVFSPIGKDVDVVWVKSYDEFVDYLTRADRLPDAICFDHDLGDGKSGYDCAKYLVEFCMDRGLKLPKWNCQSANPVGRENIDGLLNNYLKFENK